MEQNKLLDLKIDGFLSEFRITRADRERAAWRLKRMLAVEYKRGWRDRLGPTIGEFIRRREQ